MKLLTYGLMLALVATTSTTANASLLQTETDTAAQGSILMKYSASGGPTKKQSPAVALPKGSSQVRCAIAHYTPAHQFVAIAPARDPIKQGALITIFVLDHLGAVVNQFQGYAAADIISPTDFLKEPIPTGHPNWGDCVASVSRR
jgi:hypothetical protein